ncbi:phage protease [uncultured Pseudodesulfovibrio sp.]|uniref:phage protease n=1 Tax=uncultured Pseudodesulfovibrio sp. TaxID=2035858 RepID=UPI0029C77FC0|nr:phage protease [uncultured Pseudodesulfovibrio sp.]
MGLKIAILNHVLPGDGDVPEWIQLAPEGEIRLQGEPSIWLTEEGAVSVIAGFNDLNHEVVFDYEHQTLQDVQAPASGWIKELKWRGPGEDGGLWARIEWTEKAAKYIAAREYRYHSPVFLHGKTDRVVRHLVNAALTNQPRMKDVAALAAKLDVAALTAKHIHLNQGDEEMKFLETVAKALGLDAKADEEAVMKALKDRIASGKALETEVKALKDNPGNGDLLMPMVLKSLGLADGATEEDVDKALAALKASDTAVGKLGAQLNALKDQLADMKGGDLVRTALKQGQITPDDAKTWGNDLAKDNPEKFEQIVLSRKPGSEVPLEQLALKDDDSSKSAVADDTQLSINKQLGIDEETFEKFGPGAAEGGK